MNLIFERGDRDVPSGHALIYFRAEDGAILATYVSVPPIPFNLSKFVPAFLAGAMEGLDLGSNMVTTPLPPSPEEVAGIEYLRSLADRRSDDLIFAGGTNRSDIMRLMSEAAEAARQYGELYEQSARPDSTVLPAEPLRPNDQFAGLNEEEKLNQLTTLTGRLRDSLRTGEPDKDIEQDMQALGAGLPAKYHVGDLVVAAAIRGERGQKLAQLYLERCFKLYHEEYLDLERIDREIDEIAD